MNEAVYYSLSREIPTEDGRALFEWMLRKRRMWRIPRKFIARAMADLGWTLERTIRAKRDLWSTPLVDGRQWAEKTKTCFGTSYELSRITILAFMPKLVESVLRQAR